MASADQILNTLQRARSGQPDGSPGAQDLDRQISGRQSALTIPDTLAAPFSKPKAPPSARAALSAPPSPADSRGAPGYQTDVQRGGSASPAALIGSNEAQQQDHAVPQPQQGRVAAPGVYQHGRGQYSDQAEGMGFKAGFTGQPNTQNLAAADALAGRQQQESMARVATAPPTGAAAALSTPVARHSGNDWQTRNDLRNAQVSASSIMNNGGPWDRHGKGVVSPERAAYQAMLGTDQALRMALPGADTAAMQANAGLQREALHQQGANARATLAGGIDAGRLAVEQERQGVSSRDAQQIDSQRRIALDPRATPEQRSAAERALVLLGGKQPAADPYLVVPGGQQIDPVTQRAYNTPSSVFNRQSGQFVQQQGQGGGAAPHPDGQRLQGKDGRFYVVKNGVPVPE